MPVEYRKTAERLFPLGGNFLKKTPELKSIIAFSKVLGIETEYQRILSIDRDSKEMQVFLDHFQNNLDLLIQKTWVEKADERRKETLQEKTPSFIATIKTGNMFKAIEEFDEILFELAYLLFGAQSEKDDFMEYTFRIDAQIGLFWWYGGRLESLNETNIKKIADNGKTLWAVLLLGLCYLTNF